MLRLRSDISLFAGIDVDYGAAKKCLQFLRRVRIECRRRKLHVEQVDLEKYLISAYDILNLATTIPARCGGYRRQCAGRSLPKSISHRTARRHPPMPLPPELVHRREVLRAIPGPRDGLDG